MGELSNSFVVIAVFLLIILFWGDPDLHDAWVHRVWTCPQEDVAP